MNLIPKIAEMLGVGIGENFNVSDSELLFKFGQNGLLFLKDEKVWLMADEILADILCGDRKIVKKPFEPKEGETFFQWFFCGGSWSVGTRIYSSYDVDSLTNIYCGNCFRTRKEAEEHKEEIYKKLTGKEWES